MALISCQNIHISFGGRPLIENGDLQIERGDRIGLLGRNGEGKSTLLKIVSRELEPDDGKILYASGVRSGLLAQQVSSHLTDKVDTVIRSGLSKELESDHAVQKLCSLLQLDPDQSFSDLSAGRAGWHG